MNWKHRAFLVWLLPRLTYLIHAFVKLTYFTMILLYFPVGTVEGLIISYGVGILIYFQPLPNTHAIPSKQKVILWGVALILSGAYDLYLWRLVADSSNLLSM